MSVFAPDAEYIVYVKGYEPVIGKNAIEKMMKDEFENFSEYSAEKLSVCEDENGAVIEWLVTVRETQNNEVIKVQGVTIITEKNGLAQTWREYAAS